MCKNAVGYTRVTLFDFTISDCALKTCLGGCLQCEIAAKV